MQKQFLMIDNVGMHARPATTLVTMANNFQAHMRIEASGQEADLKSIMGVMALAIGSGQTFTIDIQGFDEEDAMEKITNTMAALGLAKEKK